MEFEREIEKDIWGRKERPLTEEGIVELIQEDDWMMKILKTAAELKLPDWWIGAGFVRNKVWDVLHGYMTRTSLSDIDVIYFDSEDFKINGSGGDAKKQESFYEGLLKQRHPDVNWSVKNQARMHLLHNDEPYKNSEEALAQWVETATCVAVKIDDGRLILTAPRGIDDLVSLKLRPIGDSIETIQIFNERVENKQWLNLWPNLKVVEINE